MDLSYILIYMHRIIINNLKASCIIGIKPEERLKPQDVIVDLSLSLDLSKAAASDDIEDTFDYDALAKSIVGFIEKSDFKLLEKLAYEVANLAKKNTDASEVKVIVKKPSALVEARYAAVEITLS